ncbi:ABC transporter ATP-binding protein [Plantactinospora sp. GCM10030261]|uniref:ABC transporter ATP-binding protein n=1 Tax=Plantactinospora sp. GCM10030261 TaxID=3273420 RepID=UPI00360831B1
MGDPSTFSVLASFLRPHRTVLVRGLLLGLVANAIGLATPLVTKWVLDTLGESGSLARPVAVLLALVVVGAAISLWQWIIMGTVAEQVVLDARVSMVRRFFAATIGALTHRPPGELVTRVTSDAGLLHSASSSVVGVVNSSLAMVATLVLMGILDPVLLGCTLGAVTLLGAVMSVLLPTIAAAERAAQESVGRLGGTLEGAVRAIRTVKASRAEARQADRIVADARESATHGVRAARRAAVVWTISWTGIQLAIIVILAVGAWRAGRGLIEVSTLVAFLLYAFNLMGPITELTQNVTAIQSGVAAAARIREVNAMATEVDATTTGLNAMATGVGVASAGSVDTSEQRSPTATDPRPTPARDDTRPVPAPTDTRPATGDAAPADGPILSLRGVTARYAPGTPPAVRDIELDLPRRGHTAIVGPSGAGKTTLFSLILRFLEPEAGELLLDDRPYHSWSHAEVRARLAYVEQETPVVPGTIGDNLVFGRPDADQAQVQAALAAVGLTELVDALPDGLDTSLSAHSVSGGQRQRVALARAILCAPDVLLLDEATAQVDGLTEAALHEVIRRRATEAAVVTIAHRLSTVLDADTIVVLEDGRVRARGTHAELVATDALYRQLVEALRIAHPERTDGPLVNA